MDSQEFARQLDELEANMADEPLRQQLQHQQNQPISNNPGHHATSTRDRGRPYNVLLLKNNKLGEK